MGISPPPTLLHDRRVVGIALPWSQLRVRELTHTSTNRVASIVLPRWNAGPALLSAAVGGKKRQLSHLSFVHAAIWQTRGRARSSMLTFLGQAHLCPHYQVSSPVLPRWSAGPTFPNFAAVKGEGQLPCLLEDVRARGSAHNTQRKQYQLCPSHVLRADSPMFLSIGSTLLCFPGKGLQPVRYWARYPTCWRCWMEEGIFPSRTPPHGRGKGHNLFSHFHSCPWEQGHLYFPAQVRYRTLSLGCFHQWGAKPVLPRIAACEVLGQFCTALSSLPSVVSGAMEINTVRGGVRVMNPDMGPIILAYFKFRF